MNAALTKGNAILFVTVNAADAGWRLADETGDLFI